MGAPTRKTAETKSYSSWQLFLALFPHSETSSQYDGIWQKQKKHNKC